MKFRTIGNWVLLFVSIGLIWSGSPQRLHAGQNYPRHVTVFGNSTTAPPPAPAQKVDPAEEADIRQLMATLGAKAAATRMMDSMEQSMRPLLLHAFPPGPYRERLVQLFFQKFRANAVPEHILNVSVPIYAHYFSDDEIKGLIQFYKTPLGQKWVIVGPKVQAEVLPTARSWGQQIGRESMIEVLQEHPDLARQLRAAELAAHRH